MSWTKCKNLLPEIGKLIVARIKREKYDERSNLIEYWYYAAGIVEKGQGNYLYIDTADQEYETGLEKFGSNSENEWKYVEE